MRWCGSSIRIEKRYPDHPDPFISTGKSGKAHYIFCTFLRKAACCILYFFTNKNALNRSQKQGEIMIFRRFKRDI